VSTGQRLRAAQRARRAELRLPQARGPVPELFLWSRVAIWAAAAFAFLWFEPNRHPRASVWDRPIMHELGWFSDLWARWDSRFFLQIAEHGYDRTSAAFAPLYPAALFVVGHAFGGEFVLAGIAVSLAAAFGSFLLLHRLAEERLGADGARRAVVYLAIFPMSLFLQAVYSESLYLLCALGAFVLAERRRYLPAGLAAGLAILTRSVGIALLPSLALLAWRERSRGRALAGVAAALPVAAIYPIVLWAKVGSPLAFKDAEDDWHRHLSPAGPFGGIWHGLVAGWNGLRQIVTGHGTSISGAAPMHAAAVNLEGAVFLVLFAFLAVVAWRRFGAAYGLFAALSLAIPLSVPSSRWPLLSLPRFGLVVFPFFLALAAVGGRPRVHTAILAISSLLLGVAVVQWALWQWVS
jgi:hypothetical protein